MTEHKVIPGGTFKVLVHEATANDSDKTSTVPTGKMWDIAGVNALLATTATVGNRNVRCVITDGTNTVWVAAGNAVQAASGSVYYKFVPGGYAHSSSSLNSETAASALPNPCVLMPGWTIRIYDVAAIDAAADDLTVDILGVEYTI